MGARHEGRWYETNISLHFLVAYVGLPNDDVGVATGFRRYGREQVSEPAISFNKGWGGYRRTVSSTQY